MYKKIEGSAAHTLNTGQILNFTAHADTEIDSLISRDLDLICRRIEDEIRGIVAIILVGGFGRGEGSFLVDKERIGAVNDYDLVVVTRNDEKPRKMDAMRTALAREVGIDWIDITIYSEDWFKRLPCSVYNYDLKYGGRVLRGPSRILEDIPELRAEKIPLIEAEYYLFTRLWCFLGSYSHLRSSSKDRRFFARNQLCKAGLACAEIRLITARKYHLLYNVRAKRIEEYSGDNARLCKLVKDSTDFKLRPAYNGAVDLTSHWYEAREQFLEAAIVLFEKRYRLRFENWVQFAWCYEHHWKNWLRRLYGQVRGGRGLRSAIHLNLAQLFLLIAKERDGVSERYVHLATTRLLMVQPNLSGIHAWEPACDAAVSLRMKR